MDANTSAMVAVVTGAVGTAMVVYAIRQKDPLPLVFGIGIGVVPLIVGAGWVGAFLSIALGGLFLAVRKYR